MKWLFLVHQVQTPNSRERVKVWRLTKKVGAALYRNSVYVLPDSRERLEDFQWLCQQIRDSKGEASVFVSESGSTAEDQALRALFVGNRDEEYGKILAAAERLADRMNRARSETRLSDRLLKALTQEAKQLSADFAETERTDFFGAPLSGKARTALAQIARLVAALQPQRQASPPPPRYSRKQFQGRTWATREHIHIDRLSSAWLIRRFIDPKAKFVFAPETKLPREAIPFDTFGVEFSHHGEDCTFETLLKSFQLKDAALVELAEIVHDIDMKDGKFSRPETDGLDVAVRALGFASKDDRATLAAGTVLLNGLYKHFSTDKRKE